MRGRVAQWNDSRGFGFIDTDSGKKVFAHCSQVEGDKRWLAVGEVVEFDLYEVVNKKGTQYEAVGIKRKQ